MDCLGQVSKHYISNWLDFMESIGEFGCIMRITCRFLSSVMREICIFFLPIAIRVKEATLPKVINYGLHNTSENDFQTLSKLQSNLKQIQH